MKDEDVGRAVVGDDLAFELVAERRLDSEDAPHRELLAVGPVHGRFYLLPSLLGGRDPKKLREGALVRSQRVRILAAEGDPRLEGHNR